MFHSLFQEIELNIRDTMSTVISGIMFWGGSSRMMKSLSVQLCKKLTFLLPSQMRNLGNCAS